MLLLFTILGAAVLGVFLVVLLPDKALQDKELEEVPQELTEPNITFIDPIRGSIGAKITIVEYADYGCPLCRSVEPALQQFIAEAPNKRRLVWKDVASESLGIESLNASMAARCAQDQGKFWEYHDVLMSSSLSFTAERLSNIATQLELDSQTFENCMAQGVARPIVQHTTEEALALGITGTPTLFINGVEYTGAITVEALEQAVR